MGDRELPTPNSLPPMEGRRAGPNQDYQKERERAKGRSETNPAVFRNQKKPADEDCVGAGEIGKQPWN